MDSPARVLVTGASGFLGRHVSDALKTSGCEVIPVGLETGFDLIHESAVLTAVLSTRPSIVIHLAAPPFFGEKNQGFLFRNTVKMGINVLDACALIGAKFITVTPRSIYSPNLPIFIKDKFKAVIESYLELGKAGSAVGEAKQAILHAMRRYRAQYAIPSVMLVLPSLYGDSFRTEIGVMALGVRDCMNEPEFSFDGMHGDDVIDHLFVQDAALAVVKTALTDVKFDFMNIAAPDQMTRRELVDFISKYLGYTGKIEFSGKGPATHIPLSGELAKKQLGWAPAVKLQEGVLAWLGSVMESKKTPVAAC